MLQRIVREAVCTARLVPYRYRPGIAFDFAEARRYLKNGIDLGFAQVVACSASARRTWRRARHGAGA